MGTGDYAGYQTSILGPMSLLTLPGHRTMYQTAWAGSCRRASPHSGMGRLPSTCILRAVQVLRAERASGNQSILETMEPDSGAGLSRP